MIPGWHIIAAANAGKDPQSMSEVIDNFLRWYFGACEGESLREALERRAREPHPTLAMLPRQE